MQVRDPINQAITAWRRTLLPLAWLACAALLASCASNPPAQAPDCQNMGDEMADCLVRMEQATEAHPENSNLRANYLTAKERAVNAWLAQAYQVDPVGKIGERAVLFRQVQKVDPLNDRARAGLAEIERSAHINKLLKEAQLAIGFKDYPSASILLRQALSEDPSHPQVHALQQQVLDHERYDEVDQALAFSLQQPLSIEFKDATIKQIFEVLARTSGINFVLDKDVRPDLRTSVTLKEVTVQKAVEVITLANQLDRKIVDRKSILIYANTSAKQKDFQAQTIRTFFLANSEAEQVANTLKTILKSKDVVVDKAQNMIIMRDSTDVVRMAERIVSLQDMPTPEAMLDIEVLEINRSHLESIGINYPTKLSLAPLASNAGTSVTLNDLAHLSSRTIGATVNPLQINAALSEGDIKLLAHPRVRIRNREIAKILIGDRVPNITSTSTTTGFVSENIQYLDVGLKVEATPVISIDNEVSIKIALEVSSIANQISTPSGTTAYQIGTRSASTLLRLKDGENQILAGLINDEDRRTVSKVPGLAAIPLLGHLFSEQDDNKKKTEIVLSITPHIVRNTPYPNAKLMEMESGTDTNMKMPISAPVSFGTPPQPITIKENTPSTTPVRNAGNEGGVPRGATPQEQPPGNTTRLTWAGPTDARIGSDIRQDLVIDTTQALSGLNIVIGYDNTSLKVNDVIQGPFMAADGMTPTVNQRVDASTGQIFIAITRPMAPAKGASGQGVAASLVLQVTGKPTSSEPLKVQSIIGYGTDNAPIAIVLPSSPVLTIKSDTPP